MAPEKTGGVTTFCILRSEIAGRVPVPAIIERQFEFDYDVLALEYPKAHSTA
jgi:hypothetical protein